MPAEAMHGLPAYTSGQYMQQDSIEDAASDGPCQAQFSSHVLHQEGQIQFPPSPTESSHYTHSSLASGSLPAFTDDESSESVIMLLENIVKDMIHSVNIRNFDPDAHPWSTHMLPNARVMPGNLLQAVEMDRHGYLEWLKSVCAVRPHFSQTITDLMTTMKNEKSAEVIASKDTHGSPPGLVKPSIVVLEFRLYERRGWMCTSIRSVHGIGSMPGG